MKKSLLIITLLFFVFNLFGQEKEWITIYRHTVKTSFGYGIIKMDNQSEFNPLLNVGYNYEIGTAKDLKNSFYFQTGLELTNQFATTSTLTENLSFATIPVGLSFYRRYNLLLVMKLDIGLNNNFIISESQNINSVYFNNYYTGLGCELYEYDIGFQYNLNFLNKNNQLQPLNYSSWNLYFRYAFINKRYPFPPRYF